MKYIISILLLLILFNCTESSSQEKEETHEMEINAGKLTTVQRIENRHKKEKFLSKDNIKFDMVLTFGGKERVNGTLTLATNSSQGKIELKNGDTIIFIKDKVFYSPGMNEKKARFDAYTWSYFFLFPYKLTDQGTIWSDTEKENLNGNVYNSQRLTFTSGTGYAPDDWYQVYSDSSNDLLQAAAYIVTANKSVEKAEEDPHAIVYENYQMLQAIPVATEWKFFGWRKTEGLTDTLGKATLSNFEFIENSDSLYVPPADFLSN